jgi:hypothetical protein
VILEQVWSCSRIFFVSQIFFEISLETTGDSIFTLGILEKRTAGAAAGKAGRPSGRIFVSSSGSKRLLSFPPCNR